MDGWWGWLSTNQWHFLVIRAGISEMGNKMVSLTRHPEGYLFGLFNIMLFNFFNRHRWSMLKIRHDLAMSQNFGNRIWLETGFPTYNALCIVYTSLLETPKNSQRLRNAQRVPFQPHLHSPLRSWWCWGAFLGDVASTAVGGDAYLEGSPLLSKCLVSHMYKPWSWGHLEGEFKPQFGKKTHGLITTY